MPWTPTAYDPTDFANRRHIGPSPAEMAEMLRSWARPASTS
jgi:glycine dehydrogenase